MTTYAVVRRKSSSPNSTVIQALLALVGGLGVFSFLALVVMIGFNLRYSGRVYPGVSIGGVDLSGLRPDEAATLLSQQLIYPQNGKVVFRDVGSSAASEQVWVASPAELGLSLDAQNSARAAYALGRSGGLVARLGEQLGAWYAGKSLSPLFMYDENAAQRYLAEIAAQVDLPTVEASLNVNGLDVVVLSGQVGRRVDAPATLASLEIQMRNMTDGLVPLVIEEAPPAILDATQQAEIARRILSAPLVLRIPDAQQGDSGPYLIPADQLAKMLVIERVQSPQGARYQVGLSSVALTEYLTKLAPDVNRYASDARFVFNDETHQLEVIQPAVIGRILDVEATAKLINEKIVQGEHDFPLTLSYAQPQIGNDVTGEQLGIRELVVSYSTYFRGSTQERMQNIKLAAANFHGLLVPPGAIFSMADMIGTVSLDTGYAEAWIIFGGRTIKGAGGGVCQVSTTLFRTVFFAGYPIIERYPHAYRVGYYEQTRTGHNGDLAGLDATVFVPMVDFKFQNDTPYWLLMETYFNPTARSLTWKFYSTKDGRSVDWETTGPQNIVEPPDPLYEENAELPTGVIKQVDWAAEGADVTVTRTVSRDGAVLYSDVFTTHYMPWRDVYQYGPGTDLPGKKKNPGNINPMVLFGDPLAMAIPVAMVFRQHHKAKVWRLCRWKHSFKTTWNACKGCTVISRLSSRGSPKRV